MDISRLKDKPGRDLLLLAACLLLVNLPLLFKYVIPFHDSGVFYRMFYFYYNDVFYHGEIPQWLPFGFYGFPSGYFSSFISPAAWLMGLVGLVFRVSDTLLLFSLALYVEQLVMLIGVYKLSRLLFEDRETVLFVALSTICGTVFLSQLMLNFRMSYLLPYVIYFMLKFLREGRPSRLALGLIASLLLYQGNTPYVPVIPALAGTCVFAALLVAYRGKWREFLTIPRSELLLSAALFAVFVAMLGAEFVFLRDSLLDSQLLSSGRNPDGTTVLETFLTYPNPDRLGFRKFLGMVVPIELGTGDYGSIFDTTTYFGLLPFGLMVYALVRERGRVFYALLFAVVVLGLMSLGKTTFVAEALYNWFPLMKYYRHIGYVTSTYLVLMPVMAGFGVQRLLGRAGEFSAGSRRIVLAALPAVVAVEHAAVFAMLSKGLPETGAGYFIATAAVVYAGLLAGYLAFRKYEFRRRAGLSLLLCVVLEVFIYQTAVDYRVRGIMEHSVELNHFTIAQVVETTRTNPYPYSETRMKDLTVGRQTSAYAYLQIGAPFNYDLNFVQWDPCVPMLRVDLLTKDMVAFLKIRENHPSYAADNLAAIGCTAPKARVPGSVEYADTTEQLDSMLDQSPAIGVRPVIFGVPESLRLQGSGREGAARVVSYKPNEIVINAEAPDPEGGWLYYADAWHPDWRAYVNGVPAPIYRANVAFKAVRLPRGGENLVTLRFEDRRERALQDVLIVFGVGVTLMLLLGGV